MNGKRPTSTPTPSTASLRPRRGAATAATLAAALLLAGCSASADPEPRAVPGRPTPTVTASASPTAVALPSPALSGVRGEIERSVLAYFTALNQAFATGDTSTYATTFTSGCKPCTTIRTRLDDETRKGNKPDGLRDEVSNLKVTVGTNNTGFANAFVRVPAYRIVDSKGATVGTYTESSSTVNITVLKTPQGWKVIDIADASA